MKSIHATLNTGKNIFTFISDNDIYQIEANGHTMYKDMDKKLAIDQFEMICDANREPVTKRDYINILFWTIVPISAMVGIIIIILLIVK
jgi:ElaB/YqjD/DUF883 family membrane-anchored ribosome-binding protein